MGGATHNLQYVYRCVEEGRLLETDQFVVAGKTAAQQFSSGKIVGECFKPCCTMAVKSIGG